MADTVYLIGIGGTGAKCVEAIIQLASIGLFGDQPIKLLLIDADETNGNLTRTTDTLDTYQNCYQLDAKGARSSCSWLKTEINIFLPVWSPFAKQSINKELATFFNYNSLKQSQPSLANLFDVLYTNREQTENLDVGFRGRPAIGSAVMSQVELEKLDEEPWASFIKSIRSDASGAGNKNPKILLCGSIFGGTGASGLPTIARLLDDKLKRENLRDKVKIGCLFVLPYFSFSPPTGEDPDGIYAKAEQFMLNTEAALRYYVTQGMEIFDTVYLLGNQNNSKVKFSIGKNSQRNEPHFLELYAALSAREFLWKPQKDKAVRLISRNTPNRINWGDIPDKEEVKKELANATRFAFTWLAEIAPELEKAKGRGMDKFNLVAPWLMKFFKSGNKPSSLPEFSDSKEQDNIETISKWCKNYLQWLYDVHQCEGEAIELFNYGLFAKDVTYKGDELPNLVINDSQDAGKKSKDTAKAIKVKLDSKVTNPEPGMLGLAKAVYQLCRLEN